MKKVCIIIIEKDETGIGAPIVSRKKKSSPKGTRPNGISGRISAQNQLKDELRKQGVAIL